MHMYAQAFIIFIQINSIQVFMHACIVQVKKNYPRNKIKFNEGMTHFEVVTCMYVALKMKTKRASITKKNLLH